MTDDRDHRIDRELVRALSHPIRVEILERLQGRVASPGDLSQELDRSLGVVSYHANRLLGCGCLVLVHTEGRRGALERFFAVTRPVGLAACEEAKRQRADGVGQ